MVVQDAARLVLLGRYANASQEAGALGIRYHSHVQYYVNKWRGTELGELLGVPRSSLPPSPEVSPAATTALSPAEASHGGPASQSEHLLDAMPSSVQLGPVHRRQVFVALQAGKYMDRQKVSARVAAAKVRHVYAAQRGSACVSYGTVLRYRRPQYFEACDDTWEPIHFLRETQNHRVEEYIDLLKAQGAWPPPNHR